MWKISDSECPNRHQLSPPLPIQRTQIQQQYLVQLQRWEQLRHKIKSMQLNKISVTAYLDNSKHKPKDRFLTKSEVKLDVNQNKHAKIDQPISQMVVSQNLKEVCQKIFSSKNKPKSPKKGRPTPYMASAYKMDCSRVKSCNSKRPQISRQLEKLAHNPQQIELYSDKNQQLKEINKSQYVLPLQLQIKMKKRQKNLMKNKTQSNNSHYTNNIVPNITRLEKRKSQSNRVSNDFIQLCKISPEDYTKRVIVRRKSNIDGDYVQAIEASILRRKVILFTVDVTSGNGNIFADICLKSPTNVFQVRSTNLIAPKNQNKIISHTPTKTQQLKLYLGPNQVAQYLQLFNFTQHPLQIEQSMVKVAAILVDYLRITSNGLKIEKSEIYSQFQIPRQEQKRKNILQKCQNLKRSELIQIKNNIQNRKHISKSAHKRFINSQYNIICNNKKEVKSHNINKDLQYYSIYGHPHPNINGKQYENIINYENEQIEDQKNQPRAHQKQKQKKQSVKSIRNQIEESIQKISIPHSQLSKKINHTQNQSKIKTQKSQQHVMEQSKKSIKIQNQIQKIHEDIQDKLKKQKKTLSVQEQIDGNNQSSVHQKRATTEIVNMDRQI